MIIPERIKEYIEASTDILENLSALLSDSLKYLDAQETVIFANVLEEAGIDTFDVAREVLLDYMLEELNDIEDDTSYDQFLHGFPSFSLDYVDLKELLHDAIKETPGLWTEGHLGNYYIRKG